ncbi:hypothetical protein AB0F88_23690 [Streptosporangium sp. NPDC023963]|uniref:hypothetical protein n=1 Tax=Streptosporangium sp. NPDC023963 TaxID=3155608 RepID=UPI00343BE5C6
MPTAAHTLFASAGLAATGGADDVIAREARSTAVIRQTTILTTSRRPDPLLVIPLLLIDAGTPWRRPNRPGRAPRWPGETGRS